MCDSPEAWLEQWRQRIAAIENAPRSVASRRSALEAMLRVNGPALRAIERHGDGEAVRAATLLSAQADSRIAAEDGDALPQSAE